MRDNFFTILRNGDSIMSNIIWQGDQISYIIEQYKKNKSTSELAQQFNVSPEAIRTLLRKHKIHISTLTEIQIKDFPRDSSYFKKIDTPEKAYWLGFLYADGCVHKDNTISITLKRSDEDHLNKFKNSIGAINNKIIHGEKTINGHVFEQSIFAIRDKQMANDLTRLGCMPGKTKLLKFPTYKQVPLYLMQHFIRGNFDGDGSINYIKKQNNSAWRISFCGTEDFIVGLKRVLNKSDITIEKRENISILSISGNNQVEEIGKYMWPDEHCICLNRKKEKFDQFLVERLGDEPINVGCEYDFNVFANGETLE